MKITDTIAAISSAAGNSGIGIIRVSGDEAIEVVDKIFRPANKNKKLANVESHTVHYGHIMDGDKTLDQVLVIVMKNPHSYTGEDTVEIDCHGGMLILKKSIGFSFEKRCKNCRAGRIYKESFLKWKNRFVSGWGGNGFD